jgi:prevent-host-death family protein
MLTVGIRELKQQASKLVRRVRETGGEVQITYHGKVVALLVPVQSTEKPETEARAWADIDLLAEQINRRWPEGITAQQAVAEGRR